MQYTDDESSAPSSVISGARGHGYKKPVLSTTLFKPISAILQARSSLIGRPILLSASSLDCQLIRPHQHGRLHFSPIRSADSLGPIDARRARDGVPTGYADRIQEPLAYGEASTLLPIDKRFMKPDHESNMIFEHWTDGKPPATTSGAVNIGTHACGIEGCNKAFVRKADLSRHLESHKSGPRTYECPADKCPRKQTKGFWRMDKLKDHMERKHPEIEIECWYHGWMPRSGGYRDVEKRAQHETLMRSKGYKPNSEDRTWFIEMSAEEKAAV
ncbi:MAG: hypothetical protein Q9204_004202 [Flavoplaca sp. TL-2023a]